jgi:2',3'-cyclic-nucleotide 2'-phosphodiesterase / 3'-nucleotidase
VSCSGVTIEGQIPMRSPSTHSPPQSLRLILGLTLVLALLASSVGVAGAKPGPKHDPNRLELTVMSTTDIHAHVWDWDYYANRPFLSGGQPSPRGLAHLATLAEQVRAEKPAGSTLLLDNGDHFQGTPLGYYYALKDRETGMTANPIAIAMNAIGFDAASIGNHEFNYGLDYLDAFIEQADFPMLSANTFLDGTTTPAYQPYSIERVKVKGHPPVSVGIIGFTPPGVSIWDRRFVEGVLEFRDIVESAQRFVPELAAKTDVVIALSHSGTSGTSSYGPEVPIENASALLAKHVPGIDAIVAGHSHQVVAESFITNEVTGEQVLLVQPQQHGRQLNVMELDLERHRGTWRVVGKSGRNLAAASVAAHPGILELTRAAHETTVAYVNTPIGTSTAEWSSEHATYIQAPIIDLIHAAQMEEVADRLAGTEAGELPLLSLAAPFTRTAYIPQGDVTIRDVASLYIYDNTLLAIEFTGAQVKDFLEHSARYFIQQDVEGPVDPATLTNWWPPGDDRGIPDYNYDAFAGVTYDIDVSKPIGERIVDLRFEGEPIDETQRFAVAINNYRQSGGGGFPHVRTAPVLLDEQREVRDLIIEFVTEQGTISPEDVFVPAWRLVRAGVPVF